MDNLLNRVQTLEQHVQSLQQQTASVAGRLRWWRRLASSLALLTVFGLPLSLGAGPEDRKGEDHKAGDNLLKNLLQRFLAIERKLEYVTREVSNEGHPEFVISGANLRIVNGLGFTETTNGTGNLIVGYNEPRPPGFVPVDVPVGDNRTGSHNIVVGEWQNFSSFGGLVVGVASEISGAWASVSGGVVNTANEFGASISGGARNIASGGASSISGGLFNTALGGTSSISGGTNNITTNGAVGAWVTGGFQNSASNVGASVSGGSGNTASGIDSSVSGGNNRTAAGEFDWVAGGLFQD
jgi:hypothetical protein